MKKLTIAILAASIGIFGCAKKDDETTTPTGGGDYKVEYKNQNLQGKIDGADWNYVLGEVHSSEGGFETDFAHWFSIVDTAQSDSCIIQNGERAKVIFSLDDNNKQLKPGKYPIFLDWSAGEGRTVTLVHYIPGSISNVICTSGEYEIISVDTVKQIVTGRMDAYSDNQNYINGNFTVKYCYW